MCKPSLLSSPGINIICVSRPNTGTNICVPLHFMDRKYNQKLKKTCGFLPPAGTFIQSRKKRETVEPCAQAKQLHHRGMCVYIYICVSQKTAIAFQNFSHKITSKFPSTTQWVTLHPLGIPQEPP